MGWLFLTQNCLEAYASAYTPQGQTSDQPWMAGRAAMSSSKGSQNGNPRCVIAVWQSQLQSAETMIHSFMARMSRFSLHYSSSLSPLKESMSVIHCISPIASGSILLRYAFTTELCCGLGLSIAQNLATPFLHISGSKIHCIPGSRMDSE